MRIRGLAAALCLVAFLANASWCSAQPPAGAKAKPAAAKKAADSTRYDVLYQVHVPTFADAVAGQIKDLIQKGLAQHKAQDSEQDSAIHRQLAENAQASLIRAVKETEGFAIGWRLDRPGKRTFLDLKVTALKGTALAKQMAQAAQLKTALAGFVLPDAAFSAHGVGQAFPADAAAAAKLIDMVRAKEIAKIDQQSIPDSEKATRKELGNKVFDVLHDSVASGRSDGALSVVAQPDRLTLVAAAYVADGAKLQSVAKAVGQWLQQNHPAFAGLNLDAGKFEGVSFTTLSIPAPDGGDREKFVKVFGESLEVVVGFGKEAVYFAGGKDAMKALKEAIERSKTPVALSSPFEISLRLKPLADLIALVGKGREQKVASKAASVLQAAHGKDRVRLVAEPIDRGMILRLDIEQGLLEVIGQVNPKAKKFLLGQ